MDVRAEMSNTLGEGFFLMQIGMSIECSRGVQTGALIALAVALCGCGGPESTPSETGGSASAAGGTTQELGGSSGASSLGPGGNGGSSGSAECRLEERADGPSISLTGTVCGQDVSFTTTAGQVIRLSRRSLTLPLEEITAIIVKDDPSNASIQLPEYFENFGLLFNVALEQTGPTLEVQSGEYALETGMLVACGFGSLGFRPGPAHVAIESVEGDSSGQIRMSVSDIPVLGFDPAYGQTTLPQCEGTVSVTLEGAYSHNPG